MIRQRRKWSTVTGVEHGICSMPAGFRRDWRSGGGGSQTGGVNGGAEMDAVTHSFKRLGSIGGARPCVAAVEEWGEEGLFLRWEIIFKCRWGEKGDGWHK